MKPSLRMRLFRIGSDPEFLLGGTEEWELQPMSAAAVITNDREIGTSSFIGTDGHQFTGELRPPPAHNVWRHLYDIAAGIVTTDEFLRKRKQFEKLRILALPYLNSESMGGHIHLSFFSSCPMLARAAETNAGYDSVNEQIAPYDPSRNYIIRSDEDVKWCQTFVRKAKEGAVLTPWTMAVRMDRLFVPLERWLMPWGARCRRNTRYGVGRDIVRYMTNTRPKNVPENMSYWHYEYRTPSTWLAHPTLAYIYLALAKLMALNMDNEFLNAARANIPTRQSGDRDARDALSTNNAEHKAIFWARYDEFTKTPGLRTSKDIRGLTAALMKAGSSRRRWFDPNEGVDVGAWAAIMERKGE